MKTLKTPRVKREFIDIDGTAWAVWLRPHESTLKTGYLKKVWREKYPTVATFKQFLTLTGCISKSERRHE